MFDGHKVKVAHRVRQLEASFTRKNPVETTSQRQLVTTVYEGRGYYSNVILPLLLLVGPLLLITAAGNGERDDEADAGRNVSPTPTTRLMHTASTST